MSSNIRRTKNFENRPLTDPPSRLAGDAYRTISALRMQKTGLTSSEVNQVNAIVLDSPAINDFNEKFLSLTLSFLLSPSAFQAGSSPVAIESLCKRIMVLNGLTLQGCNQALGAFAKLITTNSEFEASRHKYFCQSVFETFKSDFLRACPNRELSNVFWAAHVLQLDGREALLGDQVGSTLKSFDCTDLALVCAGLMDSPDNPLWHAVRQELLKRREFTQKDIPSILCSLACAGINDRELILHLVTVVLRTNLLTIRNLPAIVWAVGTCDSVSYELLDTAVALINHEGFKINDPMDIRRISRGFALAGQLKRIETFLIQKLTMPEKHRSSSLTDSVAIWELVTNKLGHTALTLFRKQSLASWKKLAEEASTNQSQLYHLYLASLLDSTVILDCDERDFLQSLQGSFSATTEDMSSSTLHRQASEALLKLEIEHVSEFKEETSGYVIDMYIPSTNTAVEVQGPTHFLTDLVTGASVLRPADSFKHDVLRKVAGFRIVQATPWNFGPKVQARNEILMKAILEGKPVPRQPAQRRPKRANPPPDSSS